MSAELLFVAVGSNRVSNVAKWGQNDLVAYGGGNFVVIYFPKQFKILCTLRGHSGRVNCVSWIPSLVDGNPRKLLAEDEIISGGSDKVLMVWKRGVSSKEWTQTAILKGHKDSVTSVSCIRCPDGSLVAASTSSDGTVNIWRREKDQQGWALFQTLNFSPKFMEAVSLIFAPSLQSTILALGGVDTNIHLYLESNGTFNKLLALQGHQDWIRCLTFVLCDNDDILLASSSQDSKIRLWKITKMASDSLLSSISTSSTKTTTISSKGHIFTSGASKYTVLLESVLSLHEEWVNSVCWHPLVMQEGKPHQPLCLLSASMDRTMMIWRYQTTSNLWMNEVHVGELAGNVLGLYGGVFSPDGNSIISHGFNGAFHLWENQKAKTGKEIWLPQVTVSGHFAPVSDLSWDTNQDYIVSVSEDQTARLFAPWSREQEDSATWHEISRPQIHGHDLNCLSFVNSVQHQFVSGADEKVLRVFDAPQTFVNSLQNISKIKVANDEQHARPVGANVPPLGLSNKAFFQDVTQISAENSGLASNDFDPVAPAPAPLEHHVPPVEQHLQQSTLWPEVHKLYGHPNELVCVASNRSGSLLASACRGTQPNQSAILIWDTKTWKEIARLVAHTLTVVQLEFSHDDRFLLSVSRDRQYCVFEINATASVLEIKLVAKVVAHERIVWSCSWAFDDKFFATASRDKMVKIWKSDEPKGWTQHSALPEFGNGVTAVAFAPSKTSYVLAVGLEDGLISVWKMAADQAQWSQLVQVNTSLCHCATVKRLQWRRKNDSTKKSLELASASEDHSVRLFAFSLPEVE